MATDPVMEIVPPYTPELLPEVQFEIVKYLEILSSPKRVLELGSGWSTIWFALMDGVDITSYEHDRSWYLEVARKLNELELGLNSRRYLIHDMPTEKMFLNYPKDYFDLIYIDCIDEMRNECALAARNRLKIGGMLVLDDAHWAELQSVVEHFEDWPHLEIEGTHIRKTGQQCYHRTHLYFRTPRSLI